MTQKYDSIQQSPRRRALRRGMTLVEMLVLGILYGLTLRPTV